MAQANARILPGYRLSISFTLVYLGVLVIIPLAACVVTATQLSWDQFRAAVWTERARAAYALTFGASFLAASISAVLGLLIAWVLVRYEFPGRAIVDALVDLPFALPTAVAGLVFSNLYVANGWLGRFLVPLGDRRLVLAGWRWCWCWCSSASRSWCGRSAGARERSTRVGGGGRLLGARGGRRSGG
jgi:sulfate transport system permease protein